MYISMPAVVYIALRRLGKIEVSFWSAGGFLFGVGLLGVALRGAIPDWVSFDLAVLMAYAGIALRIEAIRGELSRPRHLPILLAGVTGCWLIYVAILHLAADGARFAFYWSFSSVAISFLWMSALAIRLHRTQSLSSAIWLAAAYVPLGVLMLIRVAEVLLGMGQYGPLASGTLPPIVSIAATIACVLANTAYLGIYVERDSQMRIMQARAQARREENERLAGQIAHLDRQRGLGLLSDSLAHELSQPLSNIGLIADLGELREKPSSDRPGSSDNHAAFKEISGNVRLASGILERIRSFVRNTPPQRQVVQLDAVVGNVLALMDDWLRSEQTTVTQLKRGEALTFVGDPIQISQVMVNLLRNAAQATRGRASRQIELTLARETDTIVLCIHDNGPGFDSEFLARGIRSFSSTTLEGLGLGLSISQQIAELHGGSIGIANHPQGGAEVSLRLPAKDTSA